MGKIFFDLLCRFWRGWSSAAPWWTATHRWGTETHTTSLGLELGTAGAKFRVQNSWLKHVYSTGPSSKGFSPLSLFFKQSVTSVALRWPSSASSWGRWTTWRRSKLFRNRTGGTQLQKHHSHGSSLHFFFFSTSVSGCSSVTTPWTRSTTTSGTSPSWSISHVSLRCPVCKREEKSRGWGSTFSVVYDLLMPHKITKQEWERKWT